MSHLIERRQLYQYSVFSKQFVKNFQQFSIRKRADERRSFKRYKTIPAQNRSTSYFARTGQGRNRARIFRILD